MRRIILGALVLLLVAGGLSAWYFRSAGRPQTSFRTEPVARGELVATIGATGTLEPEEVIDVGAQVAGQITQFGTGSDSKPVDYGSAVESGTVLARIDDSLYSARVEQARATVRSAEQQLAQSRAKLEEAKAAVDQAKANIQRAEADLRQAKAKSEQSDKDWARAQALQTTGTLAQQDYDAAQSAYTANRAAVGVTEAALAQSRAAEVNSRAAVTDAEAAVGVADAAVATNKAALKQDEVNLGYCTIKSPVKGTIIDRRVTLGQTVQSSFNTPSLFLLARDLTRMTVWASVNEADIGQIKIGQPVRFAVDAYPNRSFRGSVSRVRLNATNTQNVVVYTVEVTADNADGKLLPYMTANLQFEIDRRSDAVLVPNAALRYRPPAQLIARDADASAPAEKSGQGVVWVEANGKLRPVRLQLGLSDGNVTEVVSGDLAPGAALVVGESRSGPAVEAGNPFAPPRLGGGKKQ